MIPYTSLPNLLKIDESVKQYLQIHQAMDDGRPHPFHNNQENKVSHVGWREGDSPIIDI